MRTAAGDAAAEAGLERLLVVLLTFPSGRQLMVAERQATIPWADGTPWQAYGGLLNLRSPTLSVGSEDLSDFRFGFSADDVDISVLQDDDFVPAAARVEVFAIWPDQDYTEREVLLEDARVTSFAYGRGRQAIAFACSRDDEANCRDIGDDRDEMFWYGPDFGGLLPTPDKDNEFTRADQVGRMWPIALGRCYYVPGWQDYRNQVPNLYKGNLYLVGHAIPTATDTSKDISVYQTGATDPMIASGLFDETPVVTTHTYQADSAYRPGESRKYTQIDGDGSGSSTEPFPPEDNYYHTHLIHGGAPNTEGETIIGAHMVLEHLLRESGMGIDWQRMARTLTMLRGLDIGVYIDIQTNILELIRDRIAMPNGPVPIREQQSGQGKWWSYHEGWRLPPVAHLVDGQQIDLTGEVEYKMDVRNQVTVNYGYSYGARRYLRSVVVGADNFALAAWSQSTFGLRPMDRPVETTLVGTPGMAVTLGRAVLAQQAMPRRRLQGYLGRGFYWLQPGDVVTVESPSAALGGFNISTVKAEVMERPVGLPGMVVLETFEQVPQARTV